MSSSSSSSSSESSSSSCSARNKKKGSKRKCSELDSLGDAGIDAIREKYKSVFQHRKYRDGPHAIWAILYSRLTDDPKDWWTSKKVFAECWAQYTDVAFDFDRETKCPGGWCGIKTLKKHKLVEETKMKGHGNAVFYRFTADGVQVAAIIFKRMFHPSIDLQYTLIEPELVDVEPSSGKIISKAKQAKSNDKETNSDTATHNSKTAPVNKATLKKGKKSSAAAVDAHNEHKVSDNSSSADVVNMTIDSETNKDKVDHGNAGGKSDKTSEDADKE